MTHESTRRAPPRRSCELATINANVTTFTIVNVAGQASFSGATTMRPVGAAALPFVVGLFAQRLGDRPLPGV